MKNEYVFYCVINEKFVNFYSNGAAGRPKVFFYNEPPVGATIIDKSTAIMYMAENINIGNEVFNTIVLVKVDPIFNSIEDKVGYMPDFTNVIWNGMVDSLLDLRDTLKNNPGVLLRGRAHIS